LLGCGGVVGGWVGGGGGGGGVGGGGGGGGGGWGIERAGRLESGGIYTCAITLTNRCPN